MRLPALEHLMGSYLHQDFDLFGPTPGAAAEKFMRDEPDLAMALPDEVDALTAAVTEEQLAEELKKLGCQVGPWSADKTYRSSLLELAAEARRLTRR